MGTSKYLIIENAGYEDEQVCFEFDSYREAVRFSDGWYEADEIESLHVMIAKQLLDGSVTYDF